MTPTDPITLRLTTTPAHSATYTAAPSSSPLATVRLLLALATLSLALRSHRRPGDRRHQHRHRHHHHARPPTRPTQAAPRRGRPDPAWLVLRDLKPFEPSPPSATMKPLLRSPARALLFTVRSVTSPRSDVSSLLFQPGESPHAFREAHSYLRRLPGTLLLLRPPSAFSLLAPSSAAQPRAASAPSRAASSGAAPPCRTCPRSSKKARA